MNPFSKGIRVEMPGKPDANSAIVAMPFDVALRPVSSDARVGEQQPVLDVAARADDDQQNAFLGEAQKFDLLKDRFTPGRHDHAGKMRERG